MLLQELKTRKTQEKKTGHTRRPQDATVCALSWDEQHMLQSWKQAGTDRKKIGAIIMAKYPNGAALHLPTSGEYAYRAPSTRKVRVSAPKKPKRSRARAPAPAVYEDDVNDDDDDDEDNDDYEDDDTELVAVDGGAVHYDDLAAAVDDDEVDDEDEYEDAIAPVRVVTPGRKRKLATSNYNVGSAPKIAKLPVKKPQKPLFAPNPKTGISKIETLKKMFVEGDEAAAATFNQALADAQLAYDKELYKKTYSANVKKEQSETMKDVRTIIADKGKPSSLEDVVASLKDVCTEVNNSFAYGILTVNQLIGWFDTAVHYYVRSRKSLAG